MTFLPVSANSNCGSSEVKFSRDANGALHVTIDTKRLHLRSVKASEKDYKFHENLFSDPEVMEKFGPGQARTREFAEKKIREWRNLWDQYDPYSGLAIFES